MSGLEKAFQQIESKAYATMLQPQGFTKIQTIAMVFYGKQLKLAVR